MENASREEVAAGFERLRLALLEGRAGEPLVGEDVFLQLVRERGGARKVAQECHLAHSTVSHVVQRRRWLSRDVALKFEEQYGIPAEVLMYRNKAEDLDRIRSKVE